MKTCYVCTRNLNLDDFPPNRKNKDGRNRKCRDCYNEYMRHWYAKNREVHKKRVARRKVSGVARASRYGLTPTDVDAMIDLYDGKCWCCKSREAVHIDHCHETGRVRGVLCITCNTGIGKLGDSVEGVQQALDYLTGG